jgi:hypothetical protein
MCSSSFQKGYRLQLVQLLDFCHVCVFLPIPRVEYSINPLVKLCITLCRLGAFIISIAKPNPIPFISLLNVNHIVCHYDFLSIAHITRSTVFGFRLPAFDMHCVCDTEMLFARYSVLSIYLASYVHTPTVPQSAIAAE